MMSLQESTGLPWWATIAVTTIGLRTLTSPFLIANLRQAAKYKTLQPKLTKLQERMSLARNKDIQAELALEYKEFVMKHVQPVKRLALGLAQAPIFIVMFLTLRHMADAVPALQTGGTAWFVDLTLADPYCRLPLVIAGTLLLTMKVGSADVSTPSQKYIMGGMVGVMLPFMASFPSALCVYWTTSNLFGLGFSSLARLGAFRRAFGLEAEVQKTAAFVASDMASGRPRRAEEIILEKAERAASDPAPVVFARPRQATKSSANDKRDVVQDAEVVSEATAVPVAPKVEGRPAHAKVPVKSVHKGKKASKGMKKRKR